MFYVFNFRKFIIHCGSDKWLGFSSELIVWRWRDLHCTGQHREIDPYFVYIWFPWVTCQTNKLSYLFLFTYFIYLFINKRSIVSRPTSRKLLFVCLSDSEVCFNNEIKLPAGPGGCAARTVTLAARDLADHPLGAGWCCAYEWRSEVDCLLPPARLLLDCQLRVSNGDRMKLTLINPTNPINKRSPWLLLRDQDGKQELSFNYESFQGLGNVTLSNTLHYSLYS